MGRNGNNVLDGLKIIYGGTPSNLSGYTSFLDHQLATIGESEIWGWAMQPIDYDFNNNELIAADVYDAGALADPVQGFAFTAFQVPAHPPFLRNFSSSMGAQYPVALVSMLMFLVYPIIELVERITLHWLLVMAQ